MNLTCRPATIEEVPALHQILAACGFDMQARFGLSHWVPAYPIEAMLRHAESGHLYAVLEAGDRVGTFIAATTGWKYTHAHWADPAHRALYLNKLAIVPGQQARGLGRCCLAQVEQLAYAQRCPAIRFDAVTRHPVLARFYTAHGYQPKGDLTVTDPLGRDWDVTLYEKLLDPPAPSAQIRPV